MTNKANKIRIAVVGAGGLVGREMLKILFEEQIDAEIACFGRSEKEIILNDTTYKTKQLTVKEIQVFKPNFVLFAAGADISKEWSPIFKQNGAVVIDNSSAFRRDPNIALVVPECNAQILKDLDTSKGAIIANPNCSTIGAVVALKPLDDAFQIKRIVYSTYQAVSGAGAEGLADYHNGLSGKPPIKFRFPIVNNLIPQIDDFLPNGYTKEEEKMIFETKKILGKPDIAITATTVRVPIENAHSISINVEFKKQPDIETAKKLLSNAPGITFVDIPDLPMPIYASGKNNVFAGRLRIDESCTNSLNLFTVSDNIRKGAALNAVQILKLLL